VHRVVDRVRIQHRPHHAVLAVPQSKRVGDLMQQD
jgi:hypothetical protein